MNKMNFIKNEITMEEYLNKLSNKEEFFCIIVANDDREINKIFKNYGTARKSIYSKLSNMKIKDYYLSVNKSEFEMIYKVELPILVLIKDNKLSEIVELRTLKKDINS